MTAKMTCRDYNDFLVEYVSGELDAQTKETFELHLVRCRNCKEYLTQYAAVIKAGQSACRREEEEAAAAFPEELIDAILQARGK